MMSFLALRNGHSSSSPFFFFKQKGPPFVQEPPPYSEGTQIWLLYLYNYCTSAQSGIEHNDLHQYLRGISMQFARGVGGFHSFQWTKTHFAVKTSKITGDPCCTFRKKYRPDFMGFLKGTFTFKEINTTDLDGYSIWRCTSLKTLETCCCLLLSSLEICPKLQ